MRTFTIIILLFAMPLISWSQRAYDGECIVGRSGRIASFSNEGVQFYVPQNNFYLFDQGASSIADSNGKLLIACSGFLLVDGTGDSIDGRVINENKFANYEGGTSSWSQTSIILPKGNNRYYVFTGTMSDNAFDLWAANQDFVFDMLTYHIVDMNENNGLGKVVLKNQILLKDKRLSHNRMTAVKHANGRDWWLVKPHQIKHVFYTFLVTPNGISGPYEQSINYPELEGISGLWGQSTFNQTGNQYAYCSGTSYGVYLLNFDRCSGTFSPNHFYSIPLDSSYSYDYMIGTCFSPDGKLLYANTSYQIYQMEIADTSTNSIQLIHGPDGDSVNSFAEYANINIAPDDRLYINNLNGTRSTLSYINKPNERGQACDFCQQCLTVPNTNAKGLPNMPYYHLGSLKGSACDTIGKLYTEDIKLYPNPVSNELNVYLPLDYNSEIQTSVYTISGQRLMSLRNSLNYRQEYTVDMSGLAKGIYLLRIESEGRVWKEKVVKE